MPASQLSLFMFPSPAQHRANWWALGTTKWNPGGSDSAEGHPGPHSHVTQLGRTQCTAPGEQGLGAGPGQSWWRGARWQTRLLGVWFVTQEERTLAVSPPGFRVSCGVCGGAVV